MKNFLLVEKVENGVLVRTKDFSYYVGDEDLDLIESHTWFPHREHGHIVLERKNEEKNKKFPKKIRLNREIASRIDPDLTRLDQVLFVNRDHLDYRRGNLKILKRKKADPKAVTKESPQKNETFSIEADSQKELRKIKSRLEAKIRILQSILQQVNRQLVKHTGKKQTKLKEAFRQVVQEHPEGLSRDKIIELLQARDDIPLTKTDLPRLVVSYMAEYRTKGKAVGDKEHYRAIACLKE